MYYLLFDDKNRDHLLPLTFTRPVAQIRIGITTIAEKWEFFLNNPITYITQPYLSEKFPAKWCDNSNLLINGSVIPNKELVQEILNLKDGQALVRDDIIIGICLNPAEAKKFNGITIPVEAEVIELNASVHFIKINYPWDIFTNNGPVIIEDFKNLSSKTKSQTLSNTNKIIGSEQDLFIEEGARVECAILNTSTGPIYIGKDTEIMEGSIVRGPFALCEHSVLKLGAKIYGPTTIGPYSKVGGEINNSVIFGYSNKAHDGFLGNSVIGEWCNLGADTNNSNLKNNYTEVKLWNYKADRFIKTGLQFCGLIMGDHSKCGINTMFNTGTVVGVSANIFGAGYPRNFIPSFSWGGAQGMTLYSLEKAIETTEMVLNRRNMTLSETDRYILAEVFRITEKYRNF